MVLPWGSHIVLLDIIGKNFKNLHVWNWKAGAFDIWYVVCLVNLYQDWSKCSPGVKNGPIPGFTCFT